MNPILIKEDQCSRCGLCILECPTEVITDDDDTMRLQNPERCILCGHCKAVCPEDAIMIASLNDDEFVPISESDVTVDSERLLNFFKFRRSIRQYKDHSVEKEKIEKIIEAGRFSPTGGNLQHISYIVVNTTGGMKRISELSIQALSKYGERVERNMEEKKSSGAELSPEEVSQLGYALNMQNMKTLFEKGIDRLTWNAPAMIIEHCPAGAFTASVDAGMAGMQMTLMAQSLGLGTCYVGMITTAIALSKELRTYLKVPPGNHVLIVFVLGYPNVTYQRLVSRKPANVEWF